MRNTIIKSSWLVVIALLLTFAASSSGQKRIDKPLPPIFVAEPSNPFDFTDEFYKLNGIDAEQVMNRRTGADGLSVFWKSNNPNYNNVRVLVTLPVYDHYGQMMFWSPLGDMAAGAFIDDPAGVEARRLATESPIYIFPDKDVATYAGFGDARQAPIMDPLNASIKRRNPLGLREIRIVRFLEKAFTGDGADLMGYMLKKNGAATDGTPIIKTLADLRMMEKEDMVAVEANGYFPFAPYNGQYALAPVIENPRYGAIAADAFLLLPSRDGQPLPEEMPFMDEFICLQKTGNWCMAPLP